MTQDLLATFDIYIKNKIKWVTFLRLDIFALVCDDMSKLICMILT